MLLVLVCAVAYLAKAGAGSGAVHPAWGVWRIEPSRSSTAGTVSAVRTGVTAAHSGQRQRRRRDRDCSDTMALEHGERPSQAGNTHEPDQSLTSNRKAGLTGRLSLRRFLA